MTNGQHLWLCTGFSNPCIRTDDNETPLSSREMDDSLSAFQQAAVFFPYISNFSFLTHFCAQVIHLDYDETFF